jgi:hypothetical protein
LDLPLAPAFFKWLVGEEDSLGMEDFEKLEPTVFRSLRSMAQTARDDFEHLDVVRNSNLAHSFLNFLINSDFYLSRRTVNGTDQEREEYAGHKGQLQTIH